MTAIPGNRRTPEVRRSSGTEAETGGEVINFFKKVSLPDVLQGVMDCRTMRAAPSTTDVGVHRRRRSTTTAAVTDCRSTRRASTRPEPGRVRRGAQLESEREAGGRLRFEHDVIEAVEPFGRSLNEVREAGWTAEQIME